MNQDYDPKQIEPKWQKYWEDGKLFEAKGNSDKPKYYALIEFPYPSGEGLHVGHPRPYIGMDVIARKRRMQGFNVLYPIGFDAFGLPAENYAIKTGRKPAEITAENIINFKKQIASLAISFDWSRQVNTTDPKYYKWTQWLFLQFLKHDLAYKARMTINWCPKDKIGLANEEVVNGCCERCGTPVEKREKEQWMLAITKYADRLDKDLDTVDFSERIKQQQKNWIGRSEGAEIEFKILGEDVSGIKVFTTRPDTIFGATFIAVAPAVAKQLTGKDFGITVDTERENKEKIGVDTGLRVKNPANGEEIPVWVVNYVSSEYGTGAIMGVPSDDERDAAFAKKYNLPVIENYQKAGFEDFGTRVTKFKLRDWIFSRQRYWGEPIPVIHCEKCGIVPVPEKDLPVLLPDVEKYEPTDNGESPLASITDWVNTTCPTCGGAGKRETDTMPNWAGSSWYFLAYCMNRDFFSGGVSLENWKLQIENLSTLMPVDWYNGGMEHTTLHLLYSRFWNKFLFDLGLVPTSEPYQKRTSHGFILAENGEKMSKSRGNVVNPDTIVDQFGADTLRLYEMFMGPFEQAIAWSEAALVGPRRFIERVWKLSSKIENLPDGEAGCKLKIENEVLLNQTIKKVSEDIEVLGFNTAVSSLMMYVNALEKAEHVSTEEYETLLKLLSPFAPHVSEELWAASGHAESIALAPWPEWDESKLASGEVVMAVQVNGKHRANLTVSREAGEDEVKALALSLPEVQKWLVGAAPKRVIVVLAKIVNIVV